MMYKVALGILFTIALTSVARAQSVEAETLFREAERLMAAGNLAEACASFEASNRIEPRAGTLIRLGECREQNHQLASAWSAYTDALTRVKDPRKRQLATQAAAALSLRLSQLTIMVPDETRVAGLLITRDGKALDEALWNRALPIDGGTFVIGAKAPGHEEWSTSVLVPSEGGHLTINVPRLKELIVLRPIQAPIVTAQVANIAERDHPASHEQAPILFTMNTYPVSELLRPLIMPNDIAQLRLGLGTDLSARGTFASFGVSLEGTYGYSDNFSIIGGLTDAYNFLQFSVYFGFERTLVDNLLDIRLATNLHRSAIARYCDSDPAAPANCEDPTMPGVLPDLPDGNYDAGGTKFSLDLGFPFRYQVAPAFAFVAFQTLISIDLNAVAKDHVAMVALTDNTGAHTGAMITTAVANGAAPDLNPSLGIATNPLPQLSLVVFAQLRIPDFDTSAHNFQIPITGRVEFSPNQKLDIGLEYTVLNLRPPIGESPNDNRYLNLFVQSRFGK